MFLLKLKNKVKFKLNQNKVRSLYVDIEKIDSASLNFNQMLVKL